MTQPEQKLLAERAEVEQRLARLSADYAGIVAASEGSNADDEHDPEGATIAFERSQVETLVRQARTRLEEIDAALARVRTDGWGTCEVCGRAIPDERLAVRPSARRCVQCASR